MRRLVSDIGGLLVAASCSMALAASPDGGTESNLGPRRRQPQPSPSAGLPGARRGCQRHLLEPGQPDRSRAWRHRADARADWLRGCGPDLRGNRVSRPPVAAASVLASCGWRTDGIRSLRRRQQSARRNRLLGVLRSAAPMRCGHGLPGCRQLAGSRGHRQDAHSESRSLVEHERRARHRCPVDPLRPAPVRSGGGAPGCAGTPSQAGSGSGCPSRPHSTWPARTAGAKCAHLALELALRRRPALHPGLDARVSDWRPPTGTVAAAHAGFPAGVPAFGIGLAWQQFGLDYTYLARESGGDSSGELGGPPGDPP